MSQTHHPSHHDSKHSIIPWHHPSPPQEAFNSELWHILLPLSRLLWSIPSNVCPLSGHFLCSFVLFRGEPDIHPLGHSASDYYFVSHLFGTLFVLMWWLASFGAFPQTALQFLLLRFISPGWNSSLSSLSSHVGSDIPQPILSIHEESPTFPNLHVDARVSVSLIWF